MKKVLLSLTVMALFVAAPKLPAFAGASQNGCDHSNNQANRCSDSVSVPEPPSFALVAVGLISLGGFALLVGRKQAFRS